MPKLLTKILEEWDVSNVTNMGFMLADMDNFNQNLSGWDTSNVTSMYQLFQNNTDFNQDISYWDVSKVGNMGAMFLGATSFNKDISNWCVTSITSTPTNFVSNSSALQYSNRPVCGTCPQDYNGPSISNLVVSPTNVDITTTPQSIAISFRATDTSGVNTSQLIDPVYQMVIILFVLIDQF